MVTVGMRHACALLRDHSVRCWGNDEFGQLGDEGQDALLVTPRGGMSDVLSVGAGNISTCALRADHTLWCWGSMSNHRLAGDHGDYVGSGSAPGRVEGLHDVSDFALERGYYPLTSGHGCARQGASLSCWGTNDMGQVGDGTFTPRDAPVAVRGLAL